MSFKQLMIANRGEVAIRIAEAAAELNIPTLAIYSEDDAHCRHRFSSDRAVALTGRGASAYLDQAKIIALAQDHDCDAIHPGYGFLSENSHFARACQDARISFIGPEPEALELFGNKLSARELALSCRVPVAPATSGPTSLEEMKAFFARLPEPAMVIKAVAGGGGRAIRIVRNAAEIEFAYQGCLSEAMQAFGNGDVYAEAMIQRARHIEIQIVADNHGDVVHLGERDCSLQRRQQKIIEIAPAPNLPAELRQQLTGAALKLARHAKYTNIASFEFLLGTDSNDFVFLEANPRLQVEHTVTEAVTGTDLVKTQIQIAAGKRLDQLELSQSPSLRGFAVQLRINLETLAGDGSIKPTGGVIERFETPAGAGIRVDTFGYGGYTTNPNFDSLLAKIVCFSADNQLATILKKSRRALCDLRISGVQTNRALLAAILDMPALQNWDVHTLLVDDALPDLFHKLQRHEDNLPEAVRRESSPRQTAPIFTEFLTPVESPLQGTVVSLPVGENDTVHAGQDLVIVESMKMQHAVTAPVAGRVANVLVAAGDSVWEGATLLGIEAAQVAAPMPENEAVQDPYRIRPDLAEVMEQRALGSDASQPDAVARRRQTGQRTARENIDDLCDPNSLIEYGPLVVAAQRARRSPRELREKTPGDGLVGGLASVNGSQFGKERSQCVVMSYDYSVLAGTQGQRNHRKKDRLFALAEQWRLPVVIFAEGGGDRPGETERGSASGLDCPAFRYYAKLKGQCPLVGIVSGRCFAGNAVLLGCSDVIIATKNATIGMAGPTMIEGGGLGVFTPEEVGPVDQHRVNGVVDIAVDDETEAVAAAKKYLSYFQGSTQDWWCADQHLLRTVIPQNRLQVYDVRSVIELLTDTDSALELRKDFAAGMVTSLARIEGRPIGIVANNPMHLGGAIDSAGADKAARFIQLCNAFGIPLLFLCDTPGIMVGPEAEKTALVRHAARLFVTGASIQVPFFTIVLRKAYGLGAQTMAGGTFKAPVFTLSWPTGEFGGMGLEGAVKLGYRKEIAAIDDPREREAYFKNKVDQMYELGKATTVASYFDLDDVIDPKDSRHWIVRGLDASAGQSPTRPSGKSFIDTW